MSPSRYRFAAAIAALGVAVAHYGYYRYDGADRLWAKYVGDGLGLALVCVALAISARESVGALFAAGWGALEGLQQFGCGLVAWGQAQRDADLCVQLLGPAPYVLVASALLAWFLTRKKRNE